MTGLSKDAEEDEGASCAERENREGDRGGQAEDRQGLGCREHSPQHSLMGPP